MEYMVNMDIPTDIIRGLLCCAFEGGSNYWYETVVPGSFPEGKTIADYGHGGSMQPPDNYWHWSQLLPTTGGSVQVFVNDGGGMGIEEVFTLDHALLQRGIKLMAKSHPRHFSSALNSNDDATTGDIFLQLCLFGEIIYG